MHLETLLLMNFASLAGVGKYYFLSPEGIIFIKGGIPLIMRRWILTTPNALLNNLSSRKNLSHSTKKHYLQFTKMVYFM